MWIKLAYIKSFLFVPIFLIFLSGIGQATLFDRGGGLIYDDVLDVTWLQDVAYAMTSGYTESKKLNWENAVEWVSGLQYKDTIRDQVLDDWRLPTTIDDISSIGFDLTGMSSELAYMYYVNLGYGANPSMDTEDPAPMSNNYNPFINLAYLAYWSGTLADLPREQAWYLHFHFGFQDYNETYDSLLTWAVRDGDVLNIAETADVPEPITLWLLVVSVMSLLGSRKVVEVARDYL